jgi:hypothetical protein
MRHWTPDASHSRVGFWALSSGERCWVDCGVQLTKHPDRDICTVRGVMIYLSGRVETPRHSSDALFVSPGLRATAPARLQWHYVAGESGRVGEWESGRVLDDLRFGWSRR